MNDRPREDTTATGQPAAPTIRIEDASGSWKLIMQSGVGVPCTVGVPVAQLLAGEFGLSDDDLAGIDAILLDGMPVDDIAAAVVPDASRLALAAGLPGIAGLAMKRGSAVRALRGGITHVESAPVKPQPGRIDLLLYSLVMDRFGGHFLSRGVLVSAAQFDRYARFAPGDLCRFNGEAVSASALSRRTGALEDAEFLLFADIRREN